MSDTLIEVVFNDVDDFHVADIRNFGMRISLCVDGVTVILLRNLLYAMAIDGWYTCICIWICVIPELDDGFYLI